jgi:uncharacterized repeat protein (TIGR02543 family)
MKLSGFVTLIALVGFLFAACPDEPEQEQEPEITLKYDANGATGTVPASQTVKKGSKIIIPDKGDLTYPGKYFNGWSNGQIGSKYVPGSTISLYNDITLYAQWSNIANPSIRTVYPYKEVTDDGAIRIHLETGDKYISEATEEYRLYRSTTQSGGYSVVATVSSDQLILEDTTADWLTPGSYYYKVAAVADGGEVMSTNGVKIDKVNPRVYMQYSSSPLSYGYCAVLLAYDTDDPNTWYVWEGTTNSTIRSYTLLISGTGSLPPPAGDCVLVTGTSADMDTWVIRGPLTIRMSHFYTIMVSDGEVTSFFYGSNWTSFTP